MSGHSKWSQIKRQKGIADIKRGQNFTKVSRLITLSVREGGGTDPANNFKLRLAIEKARQVNMPKENIKRAIERGSGKDLQGWQIEQSVYEGFASEGIAVIVEAVSDNKQRTASLIKHLLENYGGHLGAPGSVSYLFERRGLLRAKKGGLTSDAAFEKAVEAGALDFQETEDGCQIYTALENLHQIREKLSTAGFEIESGELVFFPKTKITISESGKVDKILNLLKELNKLDDVQNAYSNLDTSNL